MTSPTRRVPLRTSTVAVGPPGSRPDSMTLPLARRLGLALSSSRSAWSRIISMSLSTPCLVRAETSTKMVSPPQSSGTRPLSCNCWRTLSGLALGWSILLTATRMGTLAARAWLSASRVWGMTPSLAATTSTTMSVTLAPRARIELKAAWPGVSRKVICASSFFRSGMREGDGVSADVLGDAAGFTGGDVGFADDIQQGGLAVVDVAHDGHHRRRAAPGPRACPRHPARPS